MGLFSGKKKVTVTTTVVPVAEEKNLPETTKISVLEGIIKTGDIPGSLVDGLLGSVATKAHRMYDYAKNNYPLGLPEGNFGSSLDNLDIAKFVLQTRVLGRSVQFEYFNFQPLNLVHMGWERAVGELDYVAESNELRTLSQVQGVPVYLKDIKVFYSPADYENVVESELTVMGVSAQAGYTPSRVGVSDLGLSHMVPKTAPVLDPDAEQTRIEIHYEFKVTLTDEVSNTTTTEIRQGIHVWDNLVYNKEDDYYQARYNYAEDTPDGPVRKTGFWSYEEESGLYPELDSTFDDGMATLGSYFPFFYMRWNFENYGARTSTDEHRITTKALSYMNMDYESFAESINSNPGVEDVISSILVMGVPLSASSEVERRYLFEYFSRMYYSSLGHSSSVGIGRGIVFRDARFTMSLSYSQITLRSVAGSIGRKGSYSGGYDGSFFYRKQVSDAVYQEVRVYGARNTFNVLGKYSTWMENGNGSLFVPLDRAVTDSIPMPKREELFIRSLRLIFNTYVETKTKWYQTGIFKVFLFIVITLITIFTGGGGAGLYGLLGAGIGAIAIALINMIVDLVINAIIMNIAMRMVAEILGPEFAALIAIVGMVMGVAGVDLSAVSGLLPNAQTLMSMSTSLLDAANKVQTSEYQADLMKRGEEFSALQTQQDAELKRAEELLGMGSLLDPYMFVGAQPLVVFGESPSNYFTRTIHAGSTASMSLDVVSEYVNVSLMLPEPQETPDNQDMTSMLA